MRKRRLVPIRMMCGRVLRQIAEKEYNSPAEVMKEIGQVETV
jgi:hypothetical protein